MSLAPDRRVVIVGAGPVGLTTAVLLAQWGVASTVLEAAPDRDETGSKAICMQRDVLDVLDRVGCAQAMLAEGVTWWTGKTYYRDVELFTTEFPDPGASSLPPWINISQQSTAGYLFARVDAEPLVEVRLAHQVTGLRPRADLVEVDVRTADGVRTVRADYVLGADGGGSLVRREIGVDLPGHSFNDQFLITDVRVDLPFVDQRRFYFDPEWNPGRQVLVHPQPNGVWRIDWQVPADYDLEAERASGALDERIRRIVGERAYDIVWMSVYRFHERLADGFRRGRVFLAGDAAHLYAPFGARGLNSGLQDGDNLAWKLALVCNGRVHGSAAEALLDSYHTERRAAAEENLRVTNATMRFLVPHSEEQWEWRRQTLERAVTDESARGDIDSGKLAEPFWYRDSPLTTAPPQDTDLSTGPATSRPPAPGVLCPDGPATAPARPGVVRLRQLFGRGFVVLTARGADPDALVAACREACDVPVDGYALEDIDRAGALAVALGAQRGRVYLVRPDGHLAAVLDVPGPGRRAESPVVAALVRAVGGPAESGQARGRHTSHVREDHPRSAPASTPFRDPRGS